MKSLKTRKKKFTLFLDKEKTTPLTNVVITSTDNGETTNYQVTLDCDKREKEGEIDRTFEVCKCDKDMKLYISIGGESSKECVYKVGPSWEMGKCNDRRRRLLSQRHGGC
jgi:superfamily I DNA and/or RNA helicase